jgi:hypothetical protein
MSVADKSTDPSEAACPIVVIVAGSQVRYYGSIFELQLQI